MNQDSTLSIAALSVSGALVAISVAWGIYKCIRNRKAQRQRPRVSPVFPPKSPGQGFRIVIQAPPSLDLTVEKEGKAAAPSQPAVLV